MVDSVPQNHVSIFTVFYVSGIISRRCIKAWSTLELHVWIESFPFGLTGTDDNRAHSALKLFKFRPISTHNKQTREVWTRFERRTFWTGCYQWQATSQPKRPRSVLIFIPEQEECEFMSSEPSHLDVVSTGSVPYSVTDDKRSYSALIFIPEFEECRFMTSEQSLSRRRLNWQRSFWTGCHPWQSMPPKPDIFSRVEECRWEANQVNQDAAWTGSFPSRHAVTDDKWIHSTLIFIPGLEEYISMSFPRVLLEL